MKRRRGRRSVLAWLPLLSLDSKLPHFRSRFALDLPRCGDRANRPGGVNHIDRQRCTREHRKGLRSSSSGLLKVIIRSATLHTTIHMHLKPRRKQPGLSTLYDPRSQLAMGFLLSRRWPDRGRRSGRCSALSGQRFPILLQKILECKSEQPFKKSTIEEVFFFSVCYDGQVIRS